MELFGFEIKRKLDPDTKKDKRKEDLGFTTPRNTDDSTEIVSLGHGGAGYNQYLVDLGSNDASDRELIQRYRQISTYSDVEVAINQIVDQSIVSDEGKSPVKLFFDDSNEGLNDSIKEKIVDEFNTVCELLNLNDYGDDIFRNWYVDGRLFYHVIVDPKKTKQGILELRPIDPLLLKKVKEVEKEVDPKTGVEIKKVVDEYYVFSEEGIDSGLKIEESVIIHVPSGIRNPDNGKHISHLFKAIKPANNLSKLEDAMVVYRLSRAPERRVFYIDTGNLPRGKAEEYVKNIMAEYRNKITYNAETGEVDMEKRHMAMLEDFWLPRMEGGRGTEIDTLPAASNLSEIDDIIYMQRKLYRALNVPIGRLESEGQYAFGRATEITREEVSFQKFIDRLRRRFSNLIFSALGKQLVLKGIATNEEWDELKNSIRIGFAEDNYFAELKEAEILRERVETLASLDEYSGKYFSNKWIRTNILKQSDEEQKQIESEIEDEKEDGDDGVGDPDGAAWG
jgi:hypothetical protein